MDLKPYFDRAKADSDEVARLKNEVDTLFNNGTDEGIQAAIDLQPELEAANLKADQSNKLYLSMRNADNTTSNAASLFVADDDSEAEEESKTPNVMKRADWNALSPNDRATFIQNGGTLENS